MTREEVDFISGMNMCDEISNEAYKKIMCHCEEQEPCEDAVSREDVIKAVDRHTFDTDDGLCLDEDISIILEELPPVKPTQRWIPVSERLPEVHEETYYADHEEILHESDYVLACCKCGKEFVYAIGTVIHDEVCDSYEWSDLYDYAGCVIDDMQVLAWMPLPEPYKKGEEE